MLKVIIKQHKGEMHMGYNNNHVGMHMIWNRKYGEYDDFPHTPTFIVEP